MPDNTNGNEVVRENIASKTITMKVNGNNVSLKFSSERNDSVSKLIKKILLECYIKRKLKG